MREDKHFFYQEVYNIVKQIPLGRVMTYGQIARLIAKPQHSRMVGKSLHEAPSELNLPCHRVVNSKGRLAPFWHKQRILLREEGILFKENGCVDLKKHLWQLEI
ncbi:MAG: MGMT family protein [Bacteroidia bacterium]|nr:MGMT family protein [Bacteroidia bacterium]